MPKNFAEDYVDVATRLLQFKEKHPEGSLQPVDPSDPVRIITVGDRFFLQYTAAAYRSPDDQRPGIGVAWEPFPGGTPYTRDSEAMNCETSAWGRAIVAALAADTKKGVASAEEVRNRQAERENFDAAQPAPVDERAVLRGRIAKAGERIGMTPDEILADFIARTQGKHISGATVAELKAHLSWLEKQPDKWETPG